MVNSYSVFVLQSRAITFVVEPFHSRVQPKLGSRIVNTVNREDDDFFTVKIAEIQNDNLFAYSLHFLADVLYFLANMFLI